MRWNGGFSSGEERPSGSCTSQPQQKRKTAAQGSRGKGRLFLFLCTQTSRRELASQGLHPVSHTEQPPDPQEGSQSTVGMKTNFFCFLCVFVCFRCDVLLRSLALKHFPLSLSNIDDTIVVYSCERFDAPKNIIRINQSFGSLFFMPCFAQLRGIWKVGTLFSNIFHFHQYQIDVLVKMPYFRDYSMKNLT